MDVSPKRELIKYHRDKIEPFIGFVAGVEPDTNSVEAMTNAQILSTDSLFQKIATGMSDHIVDQFGSKFHSNSTWQYLYIIHTDNSADVYINNFPISMLATPTRKLAVGSSIRRGEIADIELLKFPDIPIHNSDRVAFLTKVDWFFGLYFDLNPEGIRDVETLYRNLGFMYNHLMFRQKLESLRKEDAGGRLLVNGWFPFSELSPDELELLVSAYCGEREIDPSLQMVLSNFTSTRLDAMQKKWWSNEHFDGKRDIITAGIEAWNKDEPSGYIQCYRTLSPEIEGILRGQFFDKDSKRYPSIPRLINRLRKTATKKRGSDVSMLLPSEFVDFLESSIFADFSPKEASATLSRHSSSHGVVQAEDFTKAKGLQLILTLDQLFYYL